MSLTFSVLLYSKYSSKCKNLFNIINNNKIELNLTSVCIDNKKIRNKIKRDKLFEIKEVPTIINIYSNGGAEKYEGNKAFQLIESVLVKKISPPSRIQSSEIQKELPKKQSQTVVDTKDEIEDDQPVQIPSRMKKVSTIDNIPMDDSDRNISKRPPRRIRQDENNYIEDEELFSGEVIENTREPSNTVKTGSQKNVQDPFGTLAKAKEMAQMRETTENDINKPSQRPMDARRP
jgi:hypothetical protein